jgi:hypothetical protein
LYRKVWKNFLVELSFLLAKVCMNVETLQWKMERDHTHNIKFAKWWKFSNSHKRCPHIDTKVLLLWPWLWKASTSFANTHCPNPHLTYATSNTFKMFVNAYQSTSFKHLASFKCTTFFKHTTSFNAHHKSQSLGAHKKTRSFSNGHKTWHLLMLKEKT